MRSRYRSAARVHRHAAHHARRPGEPHYRVAEGGNTVLRILKDLYETMQDPRFHTLQCLFEPWVSESETLIAHLVENDARGDLLFIDRARAVRELPGLA